MEPVVASNTIHHDATHPTALLLPVMDEAPRPLAPAPTNDQP